MALFDKHFKQNINTICYDQNKLSIVIIIYLHGTIISKY